MTAVSQRFAARGARGFFLAHLALIAFSTIAMLTVLNGPPGEWVAGEPNATIRRRGWTYSGPTYVVLGALAALLHAAGRVGASRAAGVFVAGGAISLAAELFGTSTGFPFGEYQYTTLLGPRIGGLVPFPIPISWFYMIYGCLAICGRLLPAEDDQRAKWRWAAVAGLVLVAWDVSMDPSMVKTAHWLWGSGQMFRDLGFPSWAVAFFSHDVFYGMPLSNWVGWFLTGTLIARAMLAIVPPTRFATVVSPSRLPILLYATNGIMPVALCLRDDLWWAAALGALAMAIPVGLALRRPREQRALGSDLTARVA
ncbi:MAG: carotenoid biosynthesis protein [Gemmatimonadaceae bacterium]